ncbi:hypothetical protein, partial [Anaerotruncus massiliensis (ex Togo et al. 2019)]
MKSFAYNGGKTWRKSVALLLTVLMLISATSVFSYAEMMDGSSDGMETAGTVSELEKPSAPAEESKPGGEQPPE